jgi:DNA-binding NarL/FixJ family response regulator
VTSDRVMNSMNLQDQSKDPSAAPDTGAGGSCQHCGGKLGTHAAHTHLRQTELIGKLSPVQKRVLGYFLCGLTEPQIAVKIERSKHTVHDHTKAIYQIFGVTRRIQLIQMFAETDPRALLPTEQGGKTPISANSHLTSP